jgi:Domain of unknown function (DUF4419)
VVLDAYSPYFSYGLSRVCGILSITLPGTVEDWRKIRTRVDALPEFRAGDVVPVAGADRRPVRASGLR